jgi:tetratricopeptide (TPR) repeat protein
VALGLALIGKPGNAVFISYRREVGGILAMALYQELSNLGLDAFYDMESIRVGRFDTIIMNQIAARPYFLLVLTPGTLERCAEPADWLYREIVQASTTQRVIVPMHTPGFDFDDFQRFLPGDLGRELQRLNSQELPQRWFKAAVRQLVDEFLSPLQMENAAAPASEQAAVERLLDQARAAPAVTEAQLSAQEFFERAVARTLDDPEDHDLKGRIADFSTAINLNPGYAEAFYHRGKSWAYAGKKEEAIADFSAAIRLDPEFAEAFYQRGNARLPLDREGANADYSEAIRLNPEYAAAYRARSTVRSLMGDRRGARSDQKQWDRFATDLEKSSVRQSKKLAKRLRLPPTFR